MHATAIFKRWKALIAAWVVVLGSLHEEVALAQCRTTCYPGESLVDGCCSQVSGDGGAPATVALADEVSTACISGQVRVQGTAFCCWSGQVWVNRRCRGIPSDCPTGYHVDQENERCVLSECQEGQIRSADRVTCCWPGQDVYQGTCRGIPQCPDRYVRNGEACVIDQARIDREAREARDLAAQRERDRIAQAEQARMAAEAAAQRQRDAEAAATRQRQAEALERQLRAERERAEEARRLRAPIVRAYNLASTFGAFALPLGVSAVDPAILIFGVPVEFRIGTGLLSPGVFMVDVGAGVRSQLYWWELEGRGRMSFQLWPERLALAIEGRFYGAFGNRRSRQNDYGIGYQAQALASARFSLNDADPESVRGPTHVTLTFGGGLEENWDSVGSNPTVTRGSMQYTLCENPNSAGSAPTNGQRCLIATAMRWYITGGVDLGVSPAVNLSVGSIVYLVTPEDVMPPYLGSNLTRRVMTTQLWNMPSQFTPRIGLTYKF